MTVFEARGNKGLLVVSNVGTATGSAIQFIPSYYELGRVGPGVCGQWRKPRDGASQIRALASREWR